MTKFDFIAFDTETATSNLSSLCQIGYVGVADGEIVLTESYLVKPPGNEYFVRNSCLHGIDALKTKDSEMFPVIWGIIGSHFSSNMLVAHNSSFDLGVLRATMSLYHIPFPPLHCDCTYALSKLNLAALCDALEIKMEKHHDALSDAMACAQAYIKLKSGILPNHQLIRNRPSGNVFAGHEALHGDVLKPDFDNADPNNPFFGKKVVFTGVLDTISRQEAAKIVKDKGADIDSGITKRTQYVIAGSGAGPMKLKKIADFNMRGADIKIINESDFLKMIHPV